MIASADIALAKDWEFATLSEPQVIRPYRPTPKFWRHSKYLVPLDHTALCVSGFPAPRDAVASDQLARRYPEQVCVHEVGHETDWGTIPFPAIYRGEWSWQAGAAHPVHRLCVTSYKNAGAVGRHSSLLGPDNTLVAELGYYHPDPSYIRKLPLGQFNPLHWRYHWQGDLRNRGRIPAPRYVNGTAVVLNNPWCHNYYHWMLEVAPRIMLMRRAGLTADWYVVECQSRYQQRVLELLGVPRERWIQPHYGLHLRADTLLRPSQPGTEQWHDMGAAIQASSKAQARSQASATDGPRRRIYISRKSAAHRKLANERELEQLLNRYGFESHCFEKCDFARQVELISQAEIVVSVHGAALANLIFARPGTCVVEICPLHRYNIDCFPRVSHKLGLKHVTIMASSTRFRQLLQVELDDVQAAFDLSGFKDRPQSKKLPVPSRLSSARLTEVNLLPPHPLAEC